MSVGSRWKCIDMLSVEALWWREKGAFCLFIFLLNEISASHTSEWNWLWFSKQAYSSYEVLWICLWGNIENLEILDATRKRKWLVMWHCKSFGCCRKINYYCFGMWNGCASFWFPMQQVWKCGCDGLPVMQNYEIPGRKIRFRSFFVEQNFQ